MFDQIGGVAVVALMYSVSTDVRMLDRSDVDGRILYASMESVTEVGTIGSNTSTVFAIESVYLSARRASVCIVEKESVCRSGGSTVKTSEAKN